jgi:hypothetical protein
MAEDMGKIMGYRIFFRNMILGNVFKMVPKHGSFYYSENEVQNSKPSIFGVLYGFLEQTQMGKQRDRMFFF